LILFIDGNVKKKFATWPTKLFLAKEIRENFRFQKKYFAEKEF
jgi:hypothetical protein